MIPRRLRLSREDIGNFKAERRVTSPHFAVSVASGAGVAVIISKKVAKLSVTRHLLKRRVLSVAAQTAASHSLLITLRSGAASLPVTSFKEELRSLLQKI